jgi:hypothetical protein
MKRATLGVILVIAVAIAAVFGAYAATTGDDDGPGAGGTPIGLSKCRADDPNCLARIGGQDGDPAGEPESSGGGAAGSCLVGTNCEDTPETPTKPEDTGTETTPISPSLGVCAPDTPDCVDIEVTTTSGGEE